MENIIFNELMAREFDVDVGVVEYNHMDKNGKKSDLSLKLTLLQIKGVSGIIFSQH